MSIFGQRIRVLAVVGVLCIGLSRSGAAQMAHTTDGARIESGRPVYRTKKPAKVPAARQETRGRAPSKGATWVPGFWDLQGNPDSGSRAGWVWVPGRWLTPPVQHARWDPAHWGYSDEGTPETDRWWTWFPGHWVARGPHGYPPSVTADQISQEVSPQFETR